MEPKINLVEKLEIEIEVLKEKLFTGREELIEFKTRYNQVKSAEKSIKEKKASLKKILADVSLHKDLSVIFGKKGIQAMIIASALPEIQDYANKLLARMTSGNLKVIFETKKLKKSDHEMVETLDINIKDLLGTRPYEMFSGGEAFRINFAIRIALSKILARKAGTQLKFLAIDEGFGVLDADGKMNLVSALKSVSSDFEKIIIITHIQEIKEMFDQKIEVTKDENGSHILES